MIASAARLLCETRTAEDIFAYEVLLHICTRHSHSEFEGHLTVSDLHHRVKVISDETHSAVYFSFVIEGDVGA